ncbi:ZIP family metal transporter [Stakelama tenebrarum]|uniref:ZIP family zinc transporter n=1 Tax=Stakelama tenebrarum TaxID=2711215 RepID=A0A6G6Y3R2_9SPHN|nr:hypothetical protein [Sphingosinithalassobacter tenebrarum]QIG79358.1 hypothetical protein G5C33_05850 [Sphingosinithalassobacter tenebrarum]
MLTVALMALLPAAGTLSGILLAEWKPPSRAMRGAMLHAAAGFAMALVAIDLIPRAQERTGEWIIAAAVMIGSGLSLLLARMTGKLERWMDARTGAGGAWGAYSVVLIDLCTDGLFTGSGSTISAGLGFLLALSQLLANMPGGFAVASSLRAGGLEKRPRRIALLALPAAAPLMAVLGFVALREAPDPVIGFILALLAGLLLVATIEELVPEADAPEAPRRLSSPAFALGFVLLLLGSAYLGA